MEYGQNRSRVLCLLAFLIIFVSLFGTVLTPQGMKKTKASGGWTDIPSGPDTLTIYVSSSQGSDNHDGLSESKPVRTLAKAAELVRDGYPDHILLKRGDVWVDEDLGMFKSGRSATEPMVIAYYGSSGARPLIKVDRNFIDHNGHSRDYQWFIGLHIKGYKMDPSEPAYTRAANYASMRFIGGGENILLEDCKLEYCPIVVQSFPLNDPFDPQPSENQYKDFKVRRCIIIDNYSRGSSIYDAKAQGIYAEKTDGLLIEECLFDHNGWNENFTDTLCNMYNHNMYIQYDNIGSKVVIRGNITARGSSHGMQVRAGGLVEDNLAVNNALGIFVANNQQPFGKGYTTFGICRNNVVLEGRAMLPDGNWPRSAAINGISMSLSDEVPDSPMTLEGNIVAHRLTEGTVSGITIGSPQISNINNIQFDWGGGMGDMPDPGWLDPNRSVGSYHGTLGKTPTLEAFLNEARNRGLREWPHEYTAYAVNAYIREGFTITGSAVPTEDTAVLTTTQNETQTQATQNDTQTQTTQNDTQTQVTQNDLQTQAIQNDTQTQSPIISPKKASPALYIGLTLCISAIILVLALRKFYIRR